MNRIHLQLANRTRAAVVPSLFVAAACILAASAARADDEQTSFLQSSDSAASSSVAPSDSNLNGLAGPSAQTLQMQLNEGPVLRQQDGDGPPDEPPPPPPRWRPRRRAVRSNRDARSGGIFSFGLGGAQQYVSGDGHAGAFDTNIRLGYGFSDRFQLLFDLGGSEPPQDQFQSISMWHFRMHGQTVLIGDRRGNGLNINFGLGFGGVSTYGYDNVHSASDVGVSVGAGISYEARLMPHFALAPEFFAAWQQVPNAYSRDSDIGWSMGFRLNFVFYSPF